MSDLSELYQQLIIDHGRHPRNFAMLDNATHQLEGYNPLCGDKLTVFIRSHNNVVDDIGFQGSGCAISVASASLMTEAIKGKSVAEAKAIFNDFHQMVTGDDSVDAEKLGKLAVLRGVAEYPMRVKCATLCWHTMLGAINSVQAPASTE